MTSLRSPVNFTSGIWQEGDPAARNAIREMYRFARRTRGRDRATARNAAKDAAIGIAVYQHHQRRVTP